MLIQLLKERKFQQIHSLFFCFLQGSKIVGFKFPRTLSFGRLRHESKLLNAFFVTFRIKMKLQKLACILISVIYLKMTTKLSIFFSI